MGAIIAAPDTLNVMDFEPTAESTTNKTEIEYAAIGAAMRKALKFDEAADAETDGTDVDEASDEEDEGSEDSQSSQSSEDDSDL